MIPGQWYIENVEIPWVISATYSDNKIDLDCAAFREESEDPREIIDNIVSTMSYPASSVEVLSGGLIADSLFYDEPLNITDGYEVFKGFVSAPKFIEDSFSTEYINFKITILLYIEPLGDVGVTEIADGDEVTWNDDWEEGYEKYSPPVIEEEESTPTPSVATTVQNPITTQTRTCTVANPCFTRLIAR